MKRGFTLIELLVVTAIVALLMGILLPVMGRARLQAKVLTVNAELRHIGMAPEAYSLDNGDKYPPTRVDCMLSGRFAAASLRRAAEAGRLQPSSPGPTEPLRRRRVRVVAAR